MYFTNDSIHSSSTPAAKGGFTNRVERLLDRAEQSLFLRAAWYAFIFAMVFLMSHHVVRAQTSGAALSLVPDQSVVGQGQQFEVSVHLDSAAAAYYFESEIKIEPATLVFESAHSGSLLGSSEGISIGDMLSYNTIGVSASRTSGSASGPGKLMRVRFSVKAAADAGITSIQFLNTALKDSTGHVIPTQDPPALDVQVKPRITGAGLSNKADTIHEAQSINLQAYAYAHEVTDVSSPSDSLRVWLGLNATDTDPSTWSEQQWVRAQPVKQTVSGAKQFAVQFGPALEVGIWHVASRVQLNQETYRYGGFAADTGRFWQADTASSGQLVVQERPPYQHVLARWDFDDRDPVADQALAVNRFSELLFAGSRIEGYDERGRGFTMATENWHAEQGEDSVKYMYTRLSTKGFQEIRISSDFKGTSSSARDFQLQYSLDDSVWTDVSGGSIQVGDDWGLGQLSEVLLPVAVNDLDSVYVRWKRLGDTRVDGTTDISTQGKVRMDDIRITGTALNPKKPTVWPGDANNDGLVSVSDVLPLGTWWGLQGPNRILRNISWSGLESVGWFPFEATFADTDGSGYVNHSDLEAIGLNFGQSWQQVASSATQAASAEIRLPALRTGEERYIAIHSDKPVRLSGLSAEMRWKSSHKSFDASSVSLEPVFDASDWLYGWSQNDRLLSFGRESRAAWSGAWVHKGWTKPERAGRLMRFRVKATSDWEAPVTITTGKVEIVRPDQPSVALRDIHLATSTATDAAEEPKAAEVPERTRLAPNYPNPFNPTTQLRYQLAEPSNVSLHIYTLLGKRVATLVSSRYQRAGHYSYQWNAANFSSGIYMYILKTDSKSYTGKMMLLK